MHDLYIVCAGKGSRMAVNIPKALVNITDEPCLTTTLKQIGDKFNNVFVITNRLVQGQWNEYFAELKMRYPELSANLHNVPIDSGLGDGHAVLWGFKNAHQTSRPLNFSNDVVIAWGDVFFPQNKIIDELLSKDLRYSGLLPAVTEKNPYVSLLVTDRMLCTSADFSKYGETHPTGFHDQSVFRFKRDMLWTALHSLHTAFWKGGRYITPGGELSLLHSFHYLYNSENPAQVYETDYPTLSFNDKSEVEAIQKTISEKWNGKFRPKFD